MALGTAYINVRAFSTVRRDIQRSFAGVDRDGNAAGSSLGRSFSRGFNRNMNTNVFNRVANGIRSMAPAAESTRRAFSNLQRTGLFLGSGLSGLLGGISAVIGGLASLAGSALGAIGALTALGSVIASLGVGMAAVKLALGGVGKAVGALNKGGGGGGGGGSGAAAAAAQEAANKRVEDAERSLALVIERNREELIEANNNVRKAQLALNEAIKEGREEIQQLGFDAERAALDEADAAINLEKARETLAGVQDLPPNNRARREAELAYQEAELNLRIAKDRSADLNEEQDRLAKTGVQGTEVYIDATERLAEAEAARTIVVRDGLRAQADANRDLADAIKAANDAQQNAGGGGGGGGADPFAGLNQAQINFAKFIASLKPKFDELKEIAANSFLPPLTQAITTLMGAPFERVKVGIGQVGAAMGQAAISIANAVNEGKNLDALSRLFSQSAPLLERMGSAIGNAYGVALSILNASFPNAQRFFDFLDERLNTFDNYLKSVEGNTAMTNFFQKAGDAAAQWGAILGNTFGGIGALINANLGPGTGGQILLDYFEEATARFRALDDTAEGARGLRQYFIDVANNSTKVLSSVGALVQALGRLGANQSIGQTFQALQAGVPYLESILSKLADAGPEFGRLIANITRTIDLLTDTETSEFFFNTLNFLVERLNDFLSGPIVSAVLRFIAPFQGIALALGAVGIAAATLGNYLGGVLILLFSKLGAAISFVASPIGILLLAVGGLVAAFVYFYRTNSAFADQANGLFASLAVTGLLAFNSIKDAVLQVLPPILELAQTLLSNLMPVVMNLARVLAAGLNAVMPIISTVLVGVVNLVGTLLTALQPALTMLAGIVSSGLAALVPIIQQVASVIQPVIEQLIGMLGPALVSLVPLINQVVGAFGAIVTIILRQLGPVIDGLTPLLGAVVEAIGSILDAVLPLIPAIAGPLVSAFVSIVAAVAPLIPMLINTLVPVLTQIIQLVVPFATTLLSQLAPAFTAVLNAVLPVVTTLINMLVPVIGRILQALLPLISTLLDVFAPIFDLLIQVITPLIGILVDTLVPAFTTLLDAILPLISSLLDALIPLIEALFSAIEPLIPIIADALTQSIQFLVPIIEFLANVIAALIPPIIDVVQSIAGFLIPIITTIITVLTGVINFITGVFTGNWTQAWNGVQQIFKGIVNGIIGIAENLVNTIIRGINRMVDALNGALSGIRDLTGGAINLKVPRIPTVSLPKLAEGGVVLPSRGGSIVNVAEAGRPERIEPLDQNGLSNRDRAWAQEFAAQFASGGNVTIEVTQLPNEDGEELAERISRILAFRNRRGMTA